MGQAEKTELDNKILALQQRVVELQGHLEEARTHLARETTEAERVIEGLLSQPLVMFVVADLVEGRFVQVNQKICDVLGYTEQEMIESSFLDRVHPADHLETMHVMERLVAGDQTAGFRNRHLASDGTYRVFEWTATVDPDRELSYAIAVDVTEDFPPSAAQ